jgi:hypothetical protein
MDSAALQAALLISEKAIASSSLIASWMSAILGAISILVTIGAVFVGFKFVRDAKTLEETIKREVALATMGFKTIAEEKIKEEKKNTEKQIDSLKSEIGLVWLRNVVVSKDKDLLAINKAIELATETGNADYALSMISELSDYARNNPYAVGTFYWEAMKFEDKMNKAKEIKGISDSAMELILAYEKDISALKESNPHKAPVKK